MEMYGTKQAKLLVEELSHDGRFLAFILLKLMKSDPDLFMPWCEIDNINVRNFSPFTMNPTAQGK